MQKVFDEVNSLDKKCYEQYLLSEDILMEHAALGMYDFISKEFSKEKTILIACGIGNNGADGITLARLLYKQYNITLYIPFEVKSHMAKLQLKRCENLSIKYHTTINKNLSFDIVVDCLFGSGLNKQLSNDYIDIINWLNNLQGYKIACDIPSGIGADGKKLPISFQADTTLTMGGLKKALFFDNLKDDIKTIKVINLGLPREIYDGDTTTFLLDKSDLCLPYRKQTNTHKGTFGHLAVVCGEKKGAAIIAAKSGFELGAGLVTIISKKKQYPYEIMSSKNLPYNCTAIVVGMGLGKKLKKKYIQNNIPKVIDADIFYNKKILDIILKQKYIILTPHPKEFCSLLKLTNLASIDIETLQNNRFFYLELFCKQYPNIVVLLKGANVLIGYKNKIYINNLGSAKLSFGGSGDVLAGIIGSLLAQGYSTIDAAINGSLIHTLASNVYKHNDFSLTPKKLIKQIKFLKEQI